MVVVVVVVVVMVVAVVLFVLGLCDVSVLHQSLAPAIYFSTQNINLFKTISYNTIFMKWNRSRTGKIQEQNRSTKTSLWLGTGTCSQASCTTATERAWWREFCCSNRDTVPKSTSCSVVWRSAEESTLYKFLRAQFTVGLEMGKNPKFWVRFCSGSSLMELERCFHGGHLLRINCNCNYQLTDWVSFM